MHTHELAVSKTSLESTIEAADFPNIETPTCEYFWISLESLALETDAEKQARAFLVRLCAMRLLDDSPESIFGLPGTEWTEHSFTDEQIAVLTEVCEEITDTELRARVCDILWIRCRRPEFARAAATAYIESAKRIAIGGHVGAGLRLARGISLSLTVDKGGSLPDKLVDETRNLLETTETGDFVVADAVASLLPIGVSACPELMAVCEKRASTTDNPLAQQRFYDLAFRIACRLKDNESSAKYLTSLAKSYEDEADAAPMAILAVRCLKLAIQTLRRGAETAAERDRLHAKLLKVQKKVTSEFSGVSAGKIDLSENLEHVKKRLRGKEKMAALAELILASHIQDSRRCRSNAVKNIREYPLQNLFATEKISSTQKTATTVKPTGSSDEIPDDRVLLSMLTEFECLSGIVTHGTIVPMIDAISYSHNVTMTDLMWMVAQSPYIPLGRHEFFARGLMAGLQRRFLDALHILVPQIEHMIRVLLDEKGVVVSSLDQNGYQREHDLNKLLDMPETSELMTEDVVLSLKLLFVYQAGPNLRNELCHGMLSAAQLYTPYAVYAWWLTIWLALHPVADAIRRSAESESQPTDD